MRTVNVKLTDELVDFVCSEVATADYAFASENIRDASSHPRRYHDNGAQKAESLRRKPDTSIAREERGELSPRGVMEIAGSVLGR